MALGKGNTYANDILALVLNATPIANIADDASSSPLTDLWISLHTASPEAGTQTTSECSYTGYARQSVARSNSSPEWTVSSGAAYNTNEIMFDECTVGSSTATHFAVGTGEFGSGKVLYCGELTDPLAIGVGVTPKFSAGDLDITED